VWDVYFNVVLSRDSVTSNIIMYQETSANLRLHSELSTNS